MNNDIDIGLDILCRLRAPEQTLTAHDIAEVCGCSGNYIYEIEKKALSKLRNHRYLEEYMGD